MDKFKSDIVDVETFKSASRSGIFATRTIYKGGIAAIKVFTAIDGRLNSCSIGVDSLLEGEYIACSYESPYLNHICSIDQYAITKVYCRGGLSLPWVFQPRGLCFYS